MSKANTIYKLGKISYIFWIRQKNVEIFEKKCCISTIIEKKKYLCSPLLLMIEGFKRFDVKFCKNVKILDFSASNFCWFGFVLG